MILLQEAIPAPPADYSAILPELIMFGGALLILLMIAIRRFARIEWYAAIAALTAVASAVAGVVLWNDVSGDSARFAFSGMVAADGFGTFLVVAVCVAAFLGVLMTDQYLRREGVARAEYFILLLFAAGGMQLMAISNNLVMIFLALEILSVPLYVMAAWRRDTATSQEAGAKYLLLGSFSSAIMLYGIALLYGGTGTTNLAALAQVFSENVSRNAGLVVLGMMLLIVGFAFKIAVVPFHMWTPDVYEGSPVPAVVFMAGGAKIAGFAGLIRVLESGLATLQVDWEPVLFAIAAVTVLVGSALAIVQRNVKRMLAYSSIAHAGFILIGVVSGTTEGREGALFYLVAYTFMVAGSFAVVELIARRGERHTNIEDYRGLFRREPVLATVFTFLLFAQAGIPGTSGFVAKFSVFAGAAAGDQWALVVIGTVASVVALFFYLRVIVAMYFEDPDEALMDAGGRVYVPVTAGAVLAITVVATLVLGILPGWLLDWAGNASLIFT